MRLCAFTRRSAFQTTGNASARRHTCTVGQRAQVCWQTHARAHAHLKKLPQAAFPIIIRVFYAQIHQAFLLERTMLSDSVRLSEKLHCHLHALPVHQKRIEQVTETYNCSFLHSSRLIICIFQSQHERVWNFLLRGLITRALQTTARKCLRGWNVLKQQTRVFLNALILMINKIVVFCGGWEGGCRLTFNEELMMKPTRVLSKIKRKFSLTKGLKYYFLEDVFTSLWEGGNAFFFPTLKRIRPFHSTLVPARFKGSARRGRYWAQVTAAGLFVKLRAVGMIIIKIKVGEKTIV